MSVEGGRTAALMGAPWHHDRNGGDGRSNRNGPNGPNRRNGQGRPSSVTAVQLRVLSGFDLRIGGEVVSLPANVERILGLLAVRQRPQPRLTVASTLWMDTTDDRAAANLRTALWKARQSLGDSIAVRGNLMALSPRVEVDLDGVVDLSRRLLHDEDVRLADCDPVLLVGDLLPGWDEEWILFERERLRQLCIHALEAMCRKLSEAGHAGRAIDAGLAAVAAEPLRESAQRALIAAHLQEGNVCEARRQYQAYRELLWNEMGIEPSESLRALVGLAIANPSNSSNR